MGASWGSDDRIVFSAGDPSALASVPAAGGVPQPLMGLEPEEAAFRWPHVLPGARAVVFTSFTTERNSVFSLSLTTGERRLLFEGTSARYAPTGHLLFSRDATLWGVPFDVQRLSVTGDPVPLIEGVNLRGGGNADFAMGDNGTVAYLPGGTSISYRTLVWVDREGREEPIPVPPRGYVYPRISPDGTMVALQVADQENDIWVWDFARANLSRLTFDRGLDQFPAWSPDGRRIAYSSQREGPAAQLFWQESDGRGGAERLLDEAGRRKGGAVLMGQHPLSFSPDGKHLVYREAGDLKGLALDGEKRPTPLVSTTFNEQNGEIAPDGRWLAYQSSESGLDQIYVRPFPNVEEGRWQVSSEGGSRPAWSRDGRELFYVSTGDRRLMSVEVGGSGSSFTMGVPRPLPVGGPQFMLYGIGTFPGRTYDVSPDGRKFLLIKLGAQAEGAPPTFAFVVILNWFEELRRLAPGAG